MEDQQNQQDEASASAAAVAAAAVLEDLERQHREALQERDALREQLATAQAALAQQPVVDPSATAAAQQEQASQMALERAKVKAKEEQIQTMQERLDRMQGEGDALRQEIERITNDNAKLRKEVTSAQVQAQLKESDVIPLFHEKERIQRELDSVQAHANFLQQECESKQRDVQHLQQTSRDRTLQLQLQLDHNHNELAKLGTQCSVLQQTESDLQTKLNEMTLAHQALQTELAQTVQTAAVDRQEHERTTQLRVEQLERYKERLTAVEEDNERLRSTAAQALQSGDSEVETVRAELMAKYTRLLQEQADEYETKLERQQQGGQQRRQLLLQPAAAPIAADDGNEDTEPMGMLQLLDERNTARAQLSSERARRKKAMLAVQRFQKEMAIVAPQWRQQKEELELALDRLEEYESRLKAALVEREAARSDEEEARQQVAEMEKKLQVQRAESKCLAKQVQDMLVSRAGTASTSTPIDSPVTIEQIQTQNMQLLSENRELSQTITELKSSLQSDKLEVELREARAEASTLSEQRKEQEAMVQKIVQQRDLYRALLNAQDSQALAGGESDTALTVAQTQAERAKTLEQRVVQLDGKVSQCESQVLSATRDKENAEERLRRFEAAYSEMSSANSDLQRELLSAKSEAAKAQSESTHYQERCSRLEDSNERFRNQAAEEKASCLEYQKLNTSLQNSLSSASADRNEVESAKRQMETRLRLMEAQLSEAQAAASRKAEENALLQADNARQGSMIDSIRRIESNLSAKDTAEKERLQKELESVSEKLEATRDKLAKDVENLTLEVNDWKGKTSDLERTSHGHQTAALKAKKELLESKQELKALQTKCTKLESQLKSAKRKLGEEDDGAEDVETQLQTKVDELEVELAEAKRGMAALESQVEEYKSVAQAGEQELVTVQKSTEGFKAELQRELEDLQSQLANTHKEKETRQGLIRDLTNDLAGQRGEKDKLEQELRSRISELEAQISSNADIVETAKATTQSMKQDIQKYSEEAVEAQKHYERELALHAEARGKLREAHESLQMERREKAEREEKLDALQSQLQDCEAKFNTEKETMLNDINELKENLTLRREENKTLHAQIESINAKLVAEQTSNLSEPTGDSNEDVEMKRVQGILSFLRSENESIQQQLDAANRATDREKATVESLRQSLDSARAELALVQSNAQGEESTQTVSTLQKHLSESENQVSLLRDSNKLLREESAKLESKLKDMSKKLEAAQKSAAPADDIKRELGDKIKSLEAEKASLLRDNDSWKARMKSMVNNLEQVDPEEHKKLLKKVEELQAEKVSLDALKKTTEDESKRLRTFLQQLKQKKKELETTIENQQKEIDSSRTNSSATKGEMAKMKEKVAAMEKEKAKHEEVLGGVHKQADKLRENMRSLKTQNIELKKKERQLMGELEAEKKRAAAMKTAKPSASAAKPGPSAEPRAAHAPATTTVPKAPIGGYEFGPSSVPSAKEPSSTSKPTSTATTSTAEAEGGTKRRSSGEEKLTGLKEKLMLKRRKLEQLKAAEQQDPPNDSAKSTEKKADKLETGSRSVSPKPTLMETDEKPLVPTTEDGTKKDEANNEEASVEGAAASKVDESTREVGAGDDSKAKPHGGDKKPAPSPDTTSKLATIQEAVPQPEVAAPKKPNSKDAKSIAVPSKEPVAYGSFLNIKAPGTGNKTPTFSFGDSNITLTAPSLPTPTTPLDAFGSSASFGSPAPGGKPGDIPSLFGAVAAPADAVTGEKKADEKPEAMESEE